MKKDIQNIEERNVVATGGSLVVAIPSKMAAQLKLTKESKVKIEMLTDDKLTITKVEPNPLTTTDPKFLAAAQRAKNKYAETLKMLEESDQ